MAKLRNSNETLWVIFEQCETKKKSCKRANSKKEIESQRFPGKAPNFPFLENEAEAETTKLNLVSLIDITNELVNNGRN